MTIGRALLAAFFIVAGIMHFVVPDAYVRIVPPALPMPYLLIVLSGIAEILGGCGLILPFTASGCLGSDIAARSRLSRQYLHRCLACVVSRNLWTKLDAMASFTTPNPLDSVDSALYRAIG